MNCQEVMEYMQRHLDLDLNEEEQRLLEQHIVGCSSCQEMMGRLQRLTDELTNLPKVYPPVSLVDAIMPELVKIDSQVKTGPISLQSNDSEAHIARSPRRQRRMPYRMLGGAIAAGILLGVMIMNWDSLQPAERMQASDSSGAQLTSADSMASNVIQDAPSSGEVSISNSGDQAEKSIKESRVDDQAQYTAEQYDGNDSSFEERWAPSVNDDDHQVNIEFSGDVNVSDVNGRTSQQSEEPTAGGAEGDAEHAGMQLGIAHHPDQSELVSPNGNYIAFVEDGRIVIWDASQELVYSSQAYAGVDPDSLQWHDDSRITFKAGANSAEDYFVDLSKAEEGVLGTP